MREKSSRMRFEPVSANPFRMKNSLTSMVSTILKMTASGHQIVLKLAKRGGAVGKLKYPEKVMTWIGACFKDIISLAILKDGTLNYTRSIEECLTMALEFGSTTFENGWTFQQDWMRPHIRHLNQQCSRDDSQAFMDKNR